MLLGSGELGKEFVIAAKRIGQYVVACDRYNNAPAMQVADEREVFNMLDANALDAVVYKHKPDIIIAEIEAIRTERLILYDYYATTLSELETAAEKIGFPCVVKPLMSSSGHGQSIVRSKEDLQVAFKEAIEGSRGDVKEIIIEEFIEFDSEFTLLTVTQKNGETLYCPPIGHIQKNGDYRESWQPFALPEEALKQAQEMAKKVTNALTGAGLWGVEFFLTTKNEVIFSELSPRPHDTGMVTLSGSLNLNEFELHLYAALGLPIPAIRLERYGCSAVVLAKEDKKELPNYDLSQALSEDFTIVRIFGKPEQHLHRRMGVVLCYGEIGCDMDELRNKAKRLSDTIIQ